MVTQSTSLNQAGPSIYTQRIGKFSLAKITDLIVSGDYDYTDELLQTIQDTMSATDMILHVESVKRLAEKCTILHGLLLHRKFPRKAEIELALSELTDYAEVGISPNLH